jgi:16S rRNA (cytidine1402-2'-O)-methyltransferase
VLAIGYRGSQEGGDLPSLYIVSTPIGNLEDITLRALRVLREVSLIAAEDTRKTRHLLDRYDIKTPTTSYHEHNKFAKMGYLMNKLRDGDVALVCNAGTPGISDPGYELALAALEKGIPIVPVPGPSAAFAALSVSGLPTDRFTYIGFLPYRPGAKQRMLRILLTEPGTIIALEAPHRLQKALHDIQSIMGDRRIAVCRELTKIHEEVFRGTISEALEYFAEPRGEFTLVIEGAGQDAHPIPTADAEKKLRASLQRGEKAKEAISHTSEQTGIPKKELYRAWLRLDRSGDK